MHATFYDLAGLPPSLALRAAAPLLETFMRGEVLDASIATLLAHTPARPTEPVDIILARPGGCTLQLFAWPRGAQTPVHDHTSWGIYACLSGALGEDRYVRLDDESQSGFAHVRREWQSIWRAGD